MINIQDVICSGKFVSVEFITKSGRVSTVHGRTGVKKHAKGGVRTSSNSDYIMFWDRYKGYRNVKRSTIISVNGEGVTLENRKMVAEVEHRKTTTLTRMFKRTADVAVGRR